MVMKVIKAMIGYDPYEGLGSPNVGVGLFTLKGLQINIGLCGADELVAQQTPHTLEGMIAVRCGGGSWFKFRDLPNGLTVYDLSPYSTFDGVL